MSGLKSENDNCASGGDINGSLGSAPVSFNNYKNKKSDVRKHYFLDTSSLMLNPLGMFKLASCKIDNSVVPRKTFDNIASISRTKRKRIWKLHDKRDRSSIHLHISNVMVLCMENR